ncbi:hypothetical protein BV898_03099 [Hypsibius exemplaris]|uniref:Uncharacterized protein n=1 Tax=Hypsibius exemplaris TaxID=2072580 RepID=A0A1W0X727_HYPEX|nr:hypothetical protein BV898_03099 [Hypsibius exemplaris]
MKSSPAPTVFTAETELPSSPAASSRPREEFVPDKPVWLYILGGCLGGAVVIGIALLSCYCIQRRRRARLTKLANSKVQRPAVAMMRRPENHYLPNRPVPVRSALPPPPEPEPDYMDLAELRRDVNYRRDTTALARNGQRTAENFSGRNQYGMTHSLHHEEHQRGPAAPSARIYGRASGMERGEIYGRNRASRRDYLD